MDNALKNAYLGYESDSDDADIIPDSPDCTPRDILKWKHNMFVGTKNAGHSQLAQPPEVHTSKIDSPSYPSSNDPMPSNISAVSTIEAPPFSPITPLADLNNSVVTPLPLYDTLSSKPHEELPDNFLVGTNVAPNIENINTQNNDRHSSPIRAMSPDTRKIFDILNEPDLIEYSDDSVRDPDFQPEVDNDDNSSTKSYCINITEALIHAQCSNISANNTIDNLQTYELSNNVSLNNITHQNQHSPDIQQHNEEIGCTVGRPKRGRKRKALCPREDVREKKYRNLPYYNRNNKKIDSKAFTDYKCNCKKKCSELVSKEAREIEFNKYVTLGSFEAQLIYLTSCVAENPKKRQYLTQTNTRNKKREYSRTYKLCGIIVCRDMFTNTLQVSTQKINTSLKKMRSGEMIQDKRGEAIAGWNAISGETLETVINFINRFPKYESHYRRNKTDAMFLAPGMTLLKMYELYRDEFKSMPGTHNKKECSQSTFKRIFYKKFNLRFKTLKKDTCNKCDAYAIAINNNLDQNLKLLKEEEHRKHLELAEGLRAQMNADFQKAKLGRNVECLTFDLEKTLPLPRIPTNVVFYKRQLWVYNSGIHAASNDKGYCFVWVEGESGRGAQEVGSCLLNYIKNELSDDTEELILWSDSCGGQNRNIKLTLMMKAALYSHPNLKSISMKFLEPGHSFLPNDTDFAKIETRLKQHQRVYTVDDYIDIMKSCKRNNPLKVIRMKTEDFLSCNSLEKQIVNRKTFKNRNKVSWLSTKEILLKKEDNNSIFMRSGLNGEFQELDITKKVRNQAGADFNIERLEPLWPQGKEIAQAKVDDITSMMHLIPADCHDFYNKIKGRSGIVPDIDGIDGLDFEIELQD